MQVTCFGMNWHEVIRRPDRQQFVDQILDTDDIDLHAVYLPNELWRSDSWMQHFECGEELDALEEKSSAAAAESLAAVRQVISTGVSLDELGLCNLTEGTNFLSMSPEKAQEICAHFQRFCEADEFAGLSGDSRQWLQQWRGALEYLTERKLAVFGHAG